MKTALLLSLSLLAAGATVVAVAPAASACEVDLQDPGADVRQCADDAWDLFWTVTCGVTRLC